MNLLKGLKTGWTAVVFVRHGSAFSFGFALPKNTVNTVSANDDFK